MITAGYGSSRYVRSLGAEESWWDDETEQSWWLTAARFVGGDALVKTLSDAYQAASTTVIAQTKQAIAETLRKEGTAEARKLAAEAEARIRAAAEKQAYAGGFRGMLLVGGVGLLVWLLLRRR